MNDNALGSSSKRTNRLDQKIVPFVHGQMRAGGAT